MFEDTPTEYSHFMQDLKKRLNDSRVSHEILEDADSFEYGFNANYLKKVVPFETMSRIAVWHERILRL